MKRTIFAVVFVLLLIYSVYSTWQNDRLKVEIAAQAKELQEAKTKMAMRSMMPRPPQMNMMNDPAARQAMIERQRQMTIDHATKMAAAMGLTPEQTAVVVKAFTDQIDRNVARQQRQQEMMRSDPAKRAELMAQMSQEVKDEEGKFKEALGEALYAKMKDYQTTQMLTGQANQIRGQFASSQAPLEEAQAMQLAKIVYEENTRPEATKPPTPPAPNANPAEAAADRMKAMISMREEINRHVLERAKAILKPEQLAALKQQQKAEIERIKSMMSGTGPGRPPGMPPPMVPAPGPNHTSPPRST